MRPAGEAPWWPTFDDVLEIHHRVSAREHRPAQVRSDTEARISGALARNRNRELYGGRMDDCLLAAYLALDIANLQAFVDLNKRTALASLVVFLRQRGWILRTHNSEWCATFILESATAEDVDAFAEEFAVELRLRVERLGPHLVRRLD